VEAAVNARILALLAGAVLRVRERWQRQWGCDVCDEPGIGLAFGWPEDERCPHCRTTFIYAEDGGDLGEGWDGEALSWMSPVTMPREVSRFSLTVVQRPTLQQVREMTEADAVACGAKHWPDIPGMGPRWSCDVPANTDQCLGTARFAFANRWIRDLGEKPHEDNTWERNAWTWRIEVRA
jgi:hypothetical protein